MLTSKRIDDLASLADNWDSEGSSAPSPRVIDIIRSLSFPPEYIPEVYAGSLGEVELLWRDIHLYCEVYDDRCEFAFVMGTETVCDHKSLVLTMMQLRSQVAVPK